MKITGAKVVDKEAKSAQEIENELIEAKKLEDEGNNPPAGGNPPNNEPPVETSPTAAEINEESVLSFLNEKYGKDTSSLDDYTKPQVIEKELELPEDVKAFHDYKKQTGRSLSDFINVNRDYTKMDSDEILRNYYAENNKGLNRDEINYKLKSDFGYDPDLDEESVVMDKQIAKKIKVAEATEYFNKLKEQFNVPLESSTPLVSDEERESYEAYQQYKTSAESQNSEAAKQNDFFMQKTNELFSDKFEGFKFKIGEQEVVYKPGDVDKVKEANSSLQNFGLKHLDENGYLKDAEAYHTAMTIANDPQKFAQYFYEQGQASTVDKVTKEGKNIDMDLRGGSPKNSKPKSGARIMGEDTGNKLRMKRY